MVEEVLVSLQKLKVRIAPALMLGEFIDYINLFKSALFQGLKESNVSKSGKGGYQVRSDEEHSELQSAIYDNQNPLLVASPLA